MIRFDDVGKTFRIAPGPRRKARVVEAIRSISAHIDAGGITGVVGPNGAGKSTLFALVLGFLEPTSGNISVAGQPPRRYARQRGANYLPERFQLPRDWTVRAGLRALLQLDRSPKTADALLEEFELQPYAEARAATLSRGTMQRVGIAQAVAMPRRLMVLDEPTEGLDPIWRVRFRELVRNLRSQERAVLIASHDLSEIERIADRVIILRAGAIIETLDMRSPIEQPREYTIALDKPHDAMTTLFNGARSTADGVYVVTVADTRDLSARLAALIDMGGAVVSVNPSSRLEDRIVRGSTEGI